MRHGIDGRQFGRNTSHRAAMFKNLAIALIREEQITTTVQKAKEARRVVDRLITIAKRGGTHAQRVVFARTRDAATVTKLFSALADRYKSRPGGYTRILKLSETRRGDGAEVAILELVDRPEILKGKDAPKAAKSDKKDAAPAAAIDPLKGLRRVFAGTRTKGKLATSAGQHDAEQRAKDAQERSKAKKEAKAVKKAEKTAAKKEAKASGASEGKKAGAKKAKKTKKTKKKSK